MITLLLSSLKSGTNVQLIIDIDKEKGIYLCKNPFFLQYRSFLKDQKQFAWLYQNPFLNKKGEFLTFLRPCGSKRPEVERFGAKKEAKKHPPSPRPLPIWRGCNRSACRSYINVSSTHHRVGMIFICSAMALRLSNTMLKHRGVCRAAGGEKPP